MKFYEIIFEDGTAKHGEFDDYIDALCYAEGLSEICGGFTLSEYDSEEQYNKDYFEE